MRYRRRKSKIVWIIIIISFIIIGVLLVLHYFFGKTASVSTTGIIPNLSGSEEIAGQNSAAPSDENQGISSGALPGGDEYKISFIEDYYKQPPLNYTMHNKPLPVAAKGIYVTANRAGIAEYFDGFFAVCKETEVNALVIDVKTDVGEITFKGEIPIADEMELSVNYIPNVRSVIKTLNDNGIYPIARIVAFKDNGACEKRPDLYIKNADGSLWRDSSSLESAWLNPYNKDSWDYILEIAKGAVDIGFKEIQFDYIRFDTSGRLDDADFGDTGGKTRIEIINEFTKYACEKISGWGAYVSADVYGTVIASEVDANIVGQDYRQMASYLDYICPMVYPSHYANGTFNIDYPDTEPYEVIDNAMKLSAKALEGLEHPAVVRPYLQGFTATWLRNGSRYIAYTPEEIKAQIQAASDNGIGEWIIWNPSANYDAASFEPENNLL